MIFRRHYPGSVDVSHKLSQEVSSLEDILKIEWVKEYESMNGFCRWASCGKSLMAIFDDGNVWRIVGHSDFDIDLPNYKNFIREKVVPEHIYTGGIQIMFDGRYYMIWKPSSNGKAQLGYNQNSNNWIYGKASRFEKQEAEIVAEKLRALEKNSVS